jgi:hypothetical protein
VRAACRYHTQAWYYEIFDLGRKLLMTGLMVFVERGHVAQVVFGCVVCFMVFSFNLAFSPIFDKQVHAMFKIHSATKTYVV